MRWKCLYSAIFCLYIAAYAVQAQLPFFQKLDQHVKQKWADFNCKMHELQQKTFPHTHNVGTNPCSTLTGTYGGQSLTNNGQPTQNTNPNLNGQGQPGGNNGGQSYNPSNGMPNPNNGMPNGQSNYNNGYPNNGAPNSQWNSNNGMPNGHLDPNTGYRNNQNSNGQYYPNGQLNSNQNNPDGRAIPTLKSKEQTSGGSAIVFPGDTNKNEVEGPGGRKFLNNENHVATPRTTSATVSSSGHDEENKIQTILTTATSTSTTTVRSKKKKPTKSHSAKRRKNSDYSDEDGGHNSDEDNDSNDSSEESTETVIPVTDGRKIIGDVKTNCPEGFIADRAGRCREQY